MSIMGLLLLTGIILIVVLLLKNNKKESNTQKAVDSDNNTVVENVGKEPNTQKTVNSTNNKVIKIAFSIIGTLFVLFMILRYCQRNDAVGISDYTTTVDFTTIEGVKSGIEGTVWTYTEPITSSFHMWMRLEFKDGKAYLYTAAPADGTWGKATVDNYTVKESRDVNTGERQVTVEIGSKKFVPKTGWFVYPMIQSCTMKQRDYSWD